MELLEDILIKAIVMEVKGMKLAKIGWEEKADLVICRLRTVSSQWSKVLTTNFFQLALHRILEGTEQASIRLQVLHEFSIPSPIREIHEMISLNDEIWLMGRLRDQKYEAYRYGITIYSRIDGMNEVKDVIPLPTDPRPWLIEACYVSNCAYLCWRDEASAASSVVRISKAAVEHQFDLRPWITNHSMRLDISRISVSNGGSLLVLSQQKELQKELQGNYAISVYDAAGSLQQELTLSPDVRTYRFWNIILRSNGNFVLPYEHEDSYQRNLLEVDADGNTVRQCESSLGDGSYVSRADVHGRIVIVQMDNCIGLIDAEYNLLGAYSLHQDEGEILLAEGVKYDSHRNEIISFSCDWNRTSIALTIFRFAEE